jgi:ATP-dependent Lon protease
MGECVEAKALARSVTNEFESYVKLNKRVPPEVVGVVQQIEDYAKLADTVASHLAVASENSIHLTRGERRIRT